MDIVIQQYWVLLEDGVQLFVENMPVSFYRFWDKLTREVGLFTIYVREDPFAILDSDHEKF